MDQPIFAETVWVWRRGHPRVRHAPLCFACPLAPRDPGIQRAFWLHASGGGLRAERDDQRAWWNCLDAVGGSHRQHIGDTWPGFADPGLEPVKSNAPASFWIEC